MGASEKAHLFSFDNDKDLSCILQSPAAAVAPASNQKTAPGAKKKKHKEKPPKEPNQKNGQKKGFLVSLHNTALMSAQDLEVWKHFHLEFIFLYEFLRAQEPTGRVVGGGRGCYTTTGTSRVCDCESCLVPSCSPSHQDTRKTQGLSCAAHTRTSVPAHTCTRARHTLYEHFSRLECLWLYEGNRPNLSSSLLLLKDFKKKVDVSAKATAL